MYRYTLTMSFFKRLLRIRPRPKLSLIVVIFDMPQQAQKTLLSLSSHYQRGVSDADYEVIVVENSSANELGKATAQAIGANIRYFRREEQLPTPVPAAHFGVGKARAKLLGLMIDGARMASPGLVRQLINASRAHANGVINVPGYHLGDRVQQEAMASGYDEREEARLLESIDWPGDGYRLFDIACFSRSCVQGFLLPNAESNCLCLPLHVWHWLGGFDPAFTETGGGQANPDLYKRACEHPATRLIIIPGEGTFHQFHGGVTTGHPPAEREVHMQNHFEQYRSLRGEYYQPPQTPALLYGPVAENALRFMQCSVDNAARGNTAVNGAPGPT